jgi:hypothetical protein
MGFKINAYRSWWGNPKEIDCLEGLDLAGRIGLKWILKK